MHSTLILEGVEIAGHCGLTQGERDHPQPIRIDLEVTCANSQAGKTDNIQHTIDYAHIINRLSDIGKCKHFFLIESLGEHIVQTLFEEFPILGLKLWVRKTKPPLNATVDSVGVRFARDRGGQGPQFTTSAFQPAASFLTEQQHQLPKGKILDVASGHGRNALYLANLGYLVTALDRDQEALREIQREIQHLRLTQVSIRNQDLEDGSPHSLDLGTELYEGIIVFFYLYRPLFPSLIKALCRGGVLIYETFLIDNHRIHQHPRRKDFCLQHNELLQLSQDLRIVHYEEGPTQGQNFQNQTFTARMVARKE